MIHLFSLDSRLWDSLHLAMSFIQSGQWSMGQSTPGYVTHSVWTVVYGTVYTWLCQSFSLDSGLWDSLHLAMSFIQSGQWSMGQSTPGYVIHSVWTVVYGTVYTWLCHSFSLDSGLWDSLHLAKTFIQSGHWSMGQSTHRSDIHSVWAVVYGTAYTPVYDIHSVWAAVYWQSTPGYVIHSVWTVVYVSLHLAETYIQSGQWSMGQSTPG